jgi:hypothetical protein
MNMFKNNLRIVGQTKENISQLQVDTSWKEKDVLYKFLNELIPKKISDVIPIKDYTFEIIWKDRKYFSDLMVNDSYQKILNKFKEYDIHFVWF